MSTNTSSATTGDKRVAKFLGGRATIVEVGILALYPFAIFLGLLVQLCGGDSPSYFSNKRNIINVYIIKRGWLWVTALVGLHGYSIYERKAALSQLAVRNLVVRYVLATAWWVFFTQWFFGLPIMDRVFVMTGGGCAVDAETPALGSMSSAKCRTVGGSWIGGYDPSGHTFLITHSSLFLWNELLPYIQRHYLNKSQGNVQGSEGNIREPEQQQEAPSIFKSVVFKAAAVLIFIFWWMLLMTGVYFHSIWEKIFGLGWGYIEVLVVYFASHELGPVVEQWLNVVPV